MQRTFVRYKKGLTEKKIHKQFEIRVSHIEYLTL